MNICFSWLKFSWENLSRENGFVSHENISSWRNSWVFSVLAFFLLAGFNGKFENHEPRKNIQICDFTSIVPAAAARSSNQKRPWWKEKFVGAFWWKKLWSTIYWRPPPVRPPDQSARSALLFSGSARRVPVRPRATTDMRGTMPYL